MPQYGQRFSHMFRPTLSSLARLQGGQQQDNEARQKAQTANAWGAALPALGSALGAGAGIGLSFIPGAQPFAPMIISGASALGGGIGQAAGTAVKNSGEESLDPMRERELKKAALMELLGRHR